jgi:hypothetical protein
VEVIKTLIKLQDALQTNRRKPNYSSDLVMNLGQTGHLQLLSTLAPAGTIGTLQVIKRPPIQPMFVA